MHRLEVTLDDNNFNLLKSTLSVDPQVFSQQLIRSVLSAIQSEARVSPKRQVFKYGLIREWKGLVKNRNSLELLEVLLKRTSKRSQRLWFKKYDSIFIKRSLNEYYLTCEKRGRFPTHFGRQFSSYLKERHKVEFLEQKLFDLDAEETPKTRS